MSALQSLQQRFQDKPKPETQASQACCDSDEQWQVIGIGIWKCAVCEPPPSEAMVADRRGASIPQPVVVESRCHYVDMSETEERTFGYFQSRVSVRVPTNTCPSCKGRLRTETTFTDGTTEITCWTCGWAFK